MTQFDNFSLPAKTTAQTAVAKQKEFGHTLLDVEHLALVLIEQEGTVRNTLLKLNLPIPFMQAGLIGELKQNPRHSPAYREGDDTVHFSPVFTDMLAMAAKIAGHFGTERISDEHLFLAILSQETTPAHEILKNGGADGKKVMAALRG